ncbi:MAG: glycoside hydrolase family 13 protein [Gracilimonas sp.]|uniref:glycoside hydrolase family 13 protein n=1 Tax=Gracilimonas sp. TaxID=1974203 RepID=UPI0019B81A1B|nr:glycoside hydrolase family 13 protein [Gracilimonas sp.]MBD3615937.1 glycoside hydrolase family 13 protein [Gracilimonas sp.]
MKHLLVIIGSLFFFSAFISCTEKGEAGKNKYAAPDWAKGIVWYQIFPERFRDGDPGNQPDRERARGPKGWHPTEWTQDWYKRDHWEINHTDDFYAIVRERRYGGDLQGVIDKLDYLKELGVGAIYLNPVFDAQSMHKYDASYYHHIDRNFGPDPEADVEQFGTEDPGDPAIWKWTSADSLFLKLIKEAHQRDLKIVIDGVWNHTGTEFWAFQDLIRNQEESAYKDWYIVNAFDDPATPDTNEFDYEGWWGFKGLPVFQERDENLIEPVREHIFAVTKRWMDPNGDGDPSDGIDGWRLDVAEEVGQGFWKEWHSLVREINPDAITVAEIWTDKAKEFISGELFTSVMNYRFAYAAKDFLIDDKIDTEEFVNRLEQIEEDYPDGAGHVLQNLMDSHDTARLASFTVNRGIEYEGESHPRDGFKVRKPNEEERQIQRLVALFQFTWKGAPMIYYGTESGLWGADDPDDRKPMVWKDLEYEPESRHPFGKDRPVDDNNFDKNLFSYYQKLAQLRNSEAALKKGNARILSHNEEQKLVLFQRDYGDETIWVVLNRSEKEQVIDLTEWSGSESVQNMLSGEIMYSSEVKVGPISGFILK